MVIGRKPNKIDMRIKYESVEQVDSFKYLGCNISSNMNCCQEVNRVQQWQRTFERGEKHFQWTLGIRNKEEASEGRGFVWSVALYGAETWPLRRNEQKRLESFEMWIWRRMERVKWINKIKNAVLLEKVRKGRTMLELIKKRKINWLDHWLRRNCLLNDSLEGMINGKKKFSAEEDIR